MSAISNLRKASVVVMSARCAGVPTYYFTAHVENAINNGTLF